MPEDQNPAPITDAQRLLQRRLGTDIATNHNSLAAHINAAAEQSHRTDGRTPDLNSNPGRNRNVANYSALTVGELVHENTGLRDALLEVLAASPQRKQPNIMKAIGQLRSYASPSRRESDEQLIHRAFQNIDTRDIQQLATHMQNVLNQDTNRAQNANGQNQPENYQARLRLNDTPDQPNDNLLGELNALIANRPLAGALRRRFEALAHLEEEKAADRPSYNCPLRARHIVQSLHRIEQRQRTAVPAQAPRVNPPQPEQRGAIEHDGFRTALETLAQFARNHFIAIADVDAPTRPLNTAAERAAPALHRGA